jgi:hypothetical protein
MKRGDTWTITNPGGKDYITVGQSGTAGKPITTTAYGSGAKPIINISGDYDYSVIRGNGKSYVTFDNLEITHFASTRAVTGQYGIAIMEDGSNTVPHDWAITNCTIHNIPFTAIESYGDSYNITIGDVTASSVATSTYYSNNIYDCGYGAIILCGRDPVNDTSNFKVYYNYIHDIDMAGAGIEDAYGIAFTALPTGVGYGYTDGWPVGNWAVFNRVEDNPCWEGIDSHGSSYTYITDNYIYNCHRGIATFAADKGGTYPDPTLNNCYIERNTVEQVVSPLLAGAISIFLLSEDDAHPVTNSVIRDNTIFYTTLPGSRTTDKAIMAYSLDGLIIEGNNIYNGVATASVGGILIGNSSANSTDVIIRNNWIRNWYYGIYITGSTSLQGGLLINSNIINSSFIPVYSGSENIAGRIVNNTFFTSSTSGSSMIMDLNAATIPADSTLVIENNAMGFISAVNSSYYIKTPGTITGTITINYNLWWHNTYASQFYYQAAAHNFAAWQAHGFDANGINATDPLFTNGGGTYQLASDFALQTSSPAIDAGEDVGILTDFVGHHIYNLIPDIGAYEWGRWILMRGDIIEMVGDKIMVIEQ